MSTTQYPDTLISHLGIRFTVVERGRVEATMPVDRRTCQPMGVLHGGASLALIETVAGVASQAWLGEGAKIVGAQISANHVMSVPVGKEVTAVATPLHLGRSTHVWNVDVLDPEGNMVCSARFMNFVKG